MPDQLEHALRRKTELLGSRSKAEVAAINLLQVTYETLLSKQSSSNVLAFRGRMRRPQSARLQPSSPSASLIQQVPNSPNRDAAEALEAFVSLAQLSSKLQTTAAQLESEVAGSERKCKALLADPSSYLPEVDASEMPPRLQMLLSVLGPKRFQHYVKDLYFEVARLRLHTRMYGVVYQRTSQQLKTTTQGVIATDAAIELFRSNESSSTDGLDDTIAKQPPNRTEPRFELLLQHCSDPSDSTKLSIDELLRLLQSIPVTREKLVRHAFEQVSDGWRGEGYTPPPDSIRAHRLHSVLKDSYANQQCSSNERDAVVRWINKFDQDGSGNANISLRDFIEFHNEKSDEFPLEDAEFVRYLLRIWCFDPSNSFTTASSTDRDAVARVIMNSDERSIHERLMARKRELIGKVERAQTGVCSRVEQQRLALGHISHAVICSTSVSDWWGNHELADSLGPALSGLQSLTACGFSLTEYPAFMRYLKHLEILNLRDNRLASISSSLENLLALRVLDLSSNSLSDLHFVDATVAWRLLIALREVNLSDNRLASIPWFVTQLKALNTLSLSRNRIQRISSSLLKEWSAASSLLTLDLHKNSIATLPEDIIMFSGLKTLKLHDNSLASLPVSIASLVRLEELTLTGNQLGEALRELPVTIHQQYLGLDNNQLRDFPALRIVGNNETVGTSAHVVRINARSNHIRRLPSTLGDLTFERCKELHLENNKLSEIPKTIFESLVSLEQLVLHHNRFKQLPTSIMCCKALRILDVHANRIIDIPIDLAQLTQLEILDLTDNMLQEIPIEWHAFENHKRPPPFENRVLQTLALRRNPIRNAVLKSIIDCSNESGCQIASTMTSSDRICEGVLKKLIAGLRDTSSTRLSHGDNSPDSSEDDDAVAGKAKRSLKWRGVTRDVNIYVEKRLRAMNREKHDKDKSMLVESKSFERMIKGLPFACSRVELVTLVERLRVRDSPTKQCVDGQAFLELIDTFGNRGSLSCLGARKTGAQGDQPAPILHYLSVMCRNQQRDVTETKEHVKEKPDDQERQRRAERREKLAMKKNKQQSKTTTQKSVRPSSSRGSQERQDAAASGFIKRMNSKGRDGELARQRQRVELLKQQLMDQKLRHLQQTRVKSNRVIESATLSDSDSSDSSSSSSSDVSPATIKDPSIFIRVLCAPTELGAQPLTSGKHLDIQFGALQTVLELKQHIEELTGVATGDQILISKFRGDPVGRRLCNDATIQQSVRSDLSNIQKRPYQVLLLHRHGS